MNLTISRNGAAGVGRGRMVRSKTWNREVEIGEEEENGEQDDKKDE